MRSFLDSHDCEQRTRLDDARTYDRPRVAPAAVPSEAPLDRRRDRAAHHLLVAFRSALLAAANHGAPGIPLDLPTA